MAEDWLAEADAAPSRAFFLLRDGTVGVPLTWLLGAPCNAQPQATLSMNRPTCSYNSCYRINGGSRTRRSPDIVRVLSATSSVFRKLSVSPALCRIRWAREPHGPHPEEEHEAAPARGPTGRPWPPAGHRRVQPV